MTGMQNDAPLTLKKLETEMKLRGFSKQTSKMYLFYNTKFLEYIKKPPEAVDEDDMKEYLAHKMSDHSLSNASISLIKASLKFFYAEILGKNLTLIKTPKASKKLPVVLTRQEIRDLLDNTENSKHRLLIELLYSTGLRLSECVNLKYSDLDLNDGIGWVRMGKGAKDRIFIISGMFKKDLLEYKDKSGADGKGYIFSMNGKKCRRAESSMRSRKQQSARASKKTCMCTRCAIRSPRTCLKMAWISGKYRLFWDMRICRRRRYTRRFRARKLRRLKALWICCRFLKNLITPDCINEYLKMFSVTEFCCKLPVTVL